MKEAIGSPDFKPNCAMVALDFLIRHGYIQPDGGRLQEKGGLSGKREFMYEGQEGYKSKI